MPSGQDLPLELSELAAQADPRTQTYRATLLLDPPRGVRILPGMTANVFARFAGGGPGAEGGAVVPAIAVFADDAGDPHVWVVDNDTMTVSRRAVTTGELSGSDSITVTEGLAAGETIAVSAVSYLEEGMEVRPLDGFATILTLIVVPVLYAIFFRVPNPA